MHVRKQKQDSAVPVKAPSKQSTVSFARAKTMITAIILMMIVVLDQYLVATAVIFCCLQSILAPDQLLVSVCHSWGELEVLKRDSHAYLTPTTLPIFGTLNNSWQIQHLDFGASIMHHARNACQSCKLIRCHLQVQTATAHQQDQAGPADTKQEALILMPVEQNATDSR